MKTYMLIEADTELYSLIATELTKLADGTFERGHEVEMHCDRPQFFANVSARLVSKTDAERMELPPAQNKSLKAALTNFADVNTLQSHYEGYES